MNRHSFTIVLASLAAGGIVQAVEVGEKPKTPQLPNVPYVVHDGTRPQPVKVNTIVQPIPKDRLCDACQKGRVMIIRADKRRLCSDCANSGK